MNNMVSNSINQNLNMYFLLKMLISNQFMVTLVFFQKKINFWLITYLFSLFIKYCKLEYDINVLMYFEYERYKWDFWKHLKKGNYFSLIERQILIKIILKNKKWRSLLNFELSLIGNLVISGTYTHVSHHQFTFLLDLHHEDQHKQYLLLPNWKKEQDRS